MLERAKEGTHCVLDRADGPAVVERDPALAPSSMRNGTKTASRLTLPRARPHLHKMTLRPHPVLAAGADPRLVARLSGKAA